MGTPARVTHSAEETIELGRRFGRASKPGHVFVLSGDLGAGKTQFVKGVALGLGVPDADIVTSPTFVLMNSYEGRVPIRHYDLYRIEGGELGSLGFYDFRDDSVILIEWGEKARAVGDHVRVDFDVMGENDRRLTFRGEGAGARKLLERVNLSP